MDASTPEMITPEMLKDFQPPRMASRTPGVIRGTVERILDDGAKGTRWKAIVVRAVADTVGASGPDEPEIRPSKDTLERMVVALKEPPAAKVGHDLVLFGTVDPPTHDAALPRFRNALPGGEMAMTYRAMPGRPVPPPADLAKLVNDQLRAVKSADAVSVLRGESHSDPAVADAMRLMSDPGVERYRPQSLLVADIAAIRSAEGTMRNAVYYSLPRGMAESYRDEFINYTAKGAASVFAMGNGEGGDSGDVVLPSSYLSPTMASLTAMAMTWDGSLVPRAGVDVRLDAKMTTLHELAHSHQAGFGLQRNLTKVAPGDMGCPVRLGECFADSVAVAAMVLDGEDERQVERVVMAREAAGVRGVGTHVAGLAARRAFEWARTHVQKHGVPRDEVRRVPMHKIMTVAARIARESVIESDHDLDLIRRAVERRAGVIGRASASETAAHVRQAIEDLRRNPKGLNEPDKAFATMESAANAIERSMWTAHDLSDPKRAAEHAEVVRKDMFATLAELNRKGLPRPVIDQVIEMERQRAARVYANASDGVRTRAEQRGGLEGLVQGYVNAYLDGDALAPLKNIMGLEKETIAALKKMFRLKVEPAEAIQERSGRRNAEFMAGQGAAGRIARAISILRTMRIFDHRLETDIKLARGSAETLVTAVAAAEKAAGRLADPPPRQDQMDAFVVLRSRNLVTPRNPWHHTLDKRLEMLGTISQQAAMIARLAEQDPARAPMLQERFDYLIDRRRDVLRSLTLLEETRSTLEKQLRARDPDAVMAIKARERELKAVFEDFPDVGMHRKLLEHQMQEFLEKDPSRKFVESLQAQAQWDVTGTATRLERFESDRLRSMVATAEHLGYKVVMPETAAKPAAAHVAVPKRDSRGFLIQRNAEGRPHCVDDWAVKGPNGERHAYVNGQRAFVVRMETPDGERMTTRLMPERDATTIANAYGGLVRKPTAEDFQVIRREARNEDDFLPIMPESPVRRAINL